MLHYACNRMSKLAAGLCGTRKCTKALPRRLKKRQSSTYFQSICMKFTFCRMRFVDALYPILPMFGVEKSLREEVGNVRVLLCGNVSFLTLCKCILQFAAQSGWYFTAKFDCQFYGPGTGPNTFFTGVFTLNHCISQARISPQLLTFIPAQIHPKYV